MKQGIDISRWQGNVDMAKVKAAGIEFVILREGWSVDADLEFFNNVKKCEAVQMPVMGVYHFSYALTVEEAIKEAQVAVENVKKANLEDDTIIFFDFEYDTVDAARLKGVNLDRNACNAHTEAFCEEVKRLGYIPGVYFNIDYYNNWYDFELLNKYVTWLADWDGAPDYECDFHQYTSKGSVNGISGNVDMNYFYGSEGKEVPKVLPTKTVDEIAREVIRGVWGDGEARRVALEKAGYNRKVIQDRVDEIYEEEKKKAAEKFEASKTENELQEAITLEHQLNEEVSYTAIFSTADSTEPLEPYYTSGKITDIQVGKRNPYLINSGTGWVNDDVIVNKVSNTNPQTVSATVKAGDRAKVLNPINYDTGEEIVLWFENYDVIEVVGSRAVIGQGDVQTGPIDVKFLQKV